MTPGMVPMLDPEGNPGFVPQEKADEAIRSGGQIGFHVAAPDGTPGIIPADKLAEAIKGGGKLLQHPQDQTEFEKERTPEGSSTGRFLKAAGKELVNVPTGIVGAVGSAFDPAGPVKMASQIASDDTSRSLEGRSAAYRVGAAAAGALGVNARGMEEAAERGDTAAVAGTAAGDAGIAAAMPKLMEKAKAWSAERIANKAITPKQAAVKLTDAVNPSGEGAMKKFQNDIEGQLPRIVDYAEKNGIDLKAEGRQGLLKAMEGAAKDHKQIYYEQLLEPIKDKEFRDPATGLLSDRTYGDLEARLDHLNRTTNYSPTTGAETEAQLVRKAEAIGLRDKLNRGMAAELGLEPEQIQEARSAPAKLLDLADKTQIAMDVERHSRNTAKRGNIGGVHATPHGAYGSTGGGRFGTHVTEAWENVAGHPADNAVHEVFQNLATDKPKIATPNVPKGGNPAPPRPPLTEQQARAAATRKTPPAGSTATMAEQMEAKSAAAAADEGLSGWPDEYKGAPRSTSRKGGGGANYSAADLKAFKKKHGL